MFNIFEKRKDRKPLPGKSLQSGKSVQNSANLWDEILRQFYALPVEKQDEVLYSIYKKIYSNSYRRRSYDYIVAGKC